LRLSQKIRHGWESFATRTGLRLLPPVGAALAVLAAGVILPFLPRVDALPPQFAPSLASARIARFLRAHGTLPDFGPTGAVYSTRPAFFWPAREGADSYAFRLHGEGGTELAAAQGIKETFTMIPPPGRLAPGEYRFEVKAVLKGETLPWQEHAFTVRATPADLERLHGRMGMDLTAAESDYVLLGYYSDLRSEDDVISAFLQWKTTLGETKALGKGPPSAWLATLR
jgi:hypothetical protein